VPPIEPRLLMGIVVGIVLLLGAGIAYYFTAVRTGTVDFFIATDMEMKKVHWSTWKEVKGSTAVVIVACVLIASFLYSIDTVFSALFRAIGLLVDAG
jgi:preprotein translocase SecE subunit